MRELQLLTSLASHPQRIMTRDELYGEVWGGVPRRADRSVDVYVSRLRSKLARALPESAADPHPHRDRLPLLARGLTDLARPGVTFTSFLHPRHSRVTSCRAAAESLPAATAPGPALK